MSKIYLRQAKVTVSNVSEVEYGYLMQAFQPKLEGTNNQESVAWNFVHSLNLRAGMSYNCKIEAYQNGKLVASTDGTIIIAKPKSNKKWYVVITILLIIVLGLIGYNYHKSNVQKQTVESSQISQNASNISELKADDQRVQDEINSLKDLINQYQDDKDRAGLESGLNDLKNQNQQLLRQSANMTARDQFILKTLSEAIQAIQHNTDNINQVKNQLGM